LIEFPDVHQSTTKHLINLLLNNQHSHTQWRVGLYEFYFAQDKLLAKGKAGF
jgi:hypothetical protein